MSDLIAVGRLAFARSRTLLPYLLAYMALIHLVAYIAWWMFPRTPNLQLYAGDLHLYIFGFLGFGSLPLLGAALLIFGFEEEANLDEQGTGFPPWLLRTPVASWKLAIVPLLLKSAWVFLVIAMIALTGWLIESPLPSRFFRGIDVMVPHWIFTSVALSALPVWFCALMWSSFRWRYTRLAITAASIVPALAWGIFGTAYTFTSGPFSSVRDFPLTWIDAFAPLIAFGGWAVVASIAMIAVRIARSNAAGRISENALRLFGPQTVESQAIPTGNIDFKSRSGSTSTPTRALIRYDLSLIKRLSFKYAVAAWIVVTWYACVLTDVSIENVIFLTLVYCFIAGFASEGAIYQSEQGATPNLIRSAPIATATLVWTRQALITLIRFIALSGLVAALCTCAITGASDNAAHLLEQARRQCFGSNSSVLSVTFAIATIVAIIIARHSTWSVAMLSSRNQRTGLYIFTAKSLVGFGILMLLLFRFMKFPDFESWAAATADWINHHLYFVPWFAGIKIATSVLLANRLRTAKLATLKAISVVFMVYLLLVFATAWVSSNGLPFPTVTALHWFSLMAIIVPLGRILGAPLLMASSRHGM